MNARRFSRRRGVYRSARRIFGQYEYTAVMHGGLELDVWRPRMGETESDVTTGLWALLDLMDPESAGQSA